jgi:hypothetical protein
MLTAADSRINKKEQIKMAKFQNMPGAMKGLGKFSKIKEDAGWHGSKRQPKAPAPKASAATVGRLGGFRPIGGGGGAKRFFGN